MFAVISRQLPLRLPNYRGLAYLYASIALIAAVGYWGYIHAWFPHRAAYLLQYWPIPVIAMSLIAVVGILVFLVIRYVDGLPILLVIPLAIIASGVIVLGTPPVYEFLRNDLMLQDAARLTSPLSGNQVFLSAPQESLPEDAIARSNFLGRNNTGRSFVINGQTYTLIPMTNYRLQFACGFVPTTVPYWSGDLLVHPDGTVERLTDVQAENDPRLRNLPLFPQELAYRLFLGYLDSQDIDVNTQVYQDDTSPLLIQNGNTLFWAIPVHKVGPENAVPQATTIIAVFAVDARTGAAHIELSGSEFIPASLAEQLAVTKYPKLQPNSSVARYDRLVGRGISIWNSVLYYHSIAIKNNVPVAGVWIAGDSRDVTVSSPDATHPDGAVQTVPSASAPRAASPIDLSVLPTLSTSQLLSLNQGVQAELARRLNAK